MAKENPLWGVPRIQSELHLLGYDIAESTISKYKGERKPAPSQTWKAFLDNHVGQIAATDFFTIPTATFRVLYCFLVLSQDRRKVVHFNITANPTDAWTAQQVIEAFPDDQAPKYLLRDRDSKYGEFFRRRVRGMGVQEVLIQPGSPWQNPYVERVVGSIRRECLDHVIVLGEVHLRRILTSYFHYYHRCRTHLSLGRNSPFPREVEPPSKGKIMAVPQVGGLHHHYQRCA
jgi:putative transposase